MRRRAGNSIHKAMARRGSSVKAPSIINTSKKATVFDWERVSAEERAKKQRASQEVARSRIVKVNKRKRRNPRPLLSEIEFARAHKIPTISFNRLIKGVKKLYKLRAKDRLTRDKVISNPANIADFIRKLEGNENPNLTETNILAFSNWALGRNPEKLVLIK